MSNLGTVGNFGVIHTSKDFLFSDVGLSMINLGFTIDAANTYITIPSTTTGGQSIRYLRDQFSQYEIEAERVLGVTSYDLLNMQAEKVPPGSEGLIILPFLMGERTPIWDVYASGVIFGQSLSHTKGHLTRAMMEAVAYALYDYYRLIKEFGLTQQEVARRVGQDRSTVANFLRLRNLPKPIQADIINNTLSMGHARALLGAETPAQQKEAWRRIVSENLPVRAAEGLVKKLKDRKLGASRAKGRTSEDVYMESLADDLSRYLGTRVRIIHRGDRGKVEIEFYSNEDLEQLIARLKTS